MAPRILRLDNPVQHYAWGSPTAIPELLGRDPDGSPWAELWMGGHPRAPSRAVVNARDVPVPELVGARPEAVLGDRVVRRFGPRLPYLFKVLAAAAPLSIQCHPDRDQAAAGFAREEARGIPRDAPERSYRDRNHKPELVVALSRFRALEGFRAPGAIADRLERLGVSELAPEASDLRAGGDLRAFFAAITSADANRRARALEQAERGARADRSPEAAWVRALAARHPGDIGALAPLYLHLVELAPGEALFLPARELHAYLEGTALEIMASSDNVLRGGLTTKHVDVPELVRVLSFEPSRPTPIRPEEAGGGWGVYSTPTEEFELVCADLEDGAPRDLPRGAVAIVLCTAGAIRLVDTGRGDAVPLARGEAALVPAEVEAAQVEGRGAVFAARVPVAMAAAS